MKTFLELVVLVLLLGLGTLIYALHLAEPNNLIKNHLRPALLRRDWSRNLLFLNQPGDYRYAYAGSRVKEIVVEVDWLEGIEPNHDYETWIEQMITESIKKEGKVVLAQSIGDEFKREYSYQELMALERKNRSSDLEKNLGYMHVLYLTRSTDEPTNAGMVLSDRAIFIFEDVINDLSERDDIRARVERSTLIHEWGHLLGLNHTTENNCVMSETVEVYGNRQFQFNNIPVTHCTDTIIELERLRKEAKY